MWATQFNKEKGYFYSLSLSVCLTVCLYVLPPTSLNIISCKYENRQRLQFAVEFAEQDEKKQCAIFARLCRHCQGKAKHTSEYWRRLSFLANQTGLPLTF